MTPFSAGITFENPGDLTVTINGNSCSYVEDPDTGLVFTQVYIAFTPHFTNAEGQVRVTGFPRAAFNGNYSLPITIAQSFDFPPNMTHLCASIDSGHDYATIVASGSHYAAANVTANELVSGGNYFLVFSGHYAYQ